MLALTVFYVFGFGSIEHGKLNEASDASAAIIIVSVPNWAEPAGTSVAFNVQDTVIPAEGFAVSIGIIEEFLPFIMLRDFV